MSDTYRRYRAIRTALMQCFRSLKGHLNTLVALICGIALMPSWQRRVHRGDRCDLSLFQLGMRLLSYCLKEGSPTPKGLLPTLPAPLTA